MALKFEETARSRTKAGAAYMLWVLGLGEPPSVVRSLAQSITEKGYFDLRGVMEFVTTEVWLKLR